MLKLIFMSAFVYLPHPAWIVGALCVPQTSTPFNREGKHGTMHLALCVFLKSYRLIPDFVTQKIRIL